MNGLKPSELYLITSGTSGYSSLNTPNLPTYDFIIPVKVFHQDKDSELINSIDNWCLEHIGEKYVTWFRGLNKYSFFRKEHYIACTLAWGNYENSSL